ncbi:MAG: hypothetical protein ACI83B_000925 [Sediminicola sp.]|jgi:hypothetical protein|tara:strand:- start:1289 stop:1426 length:138 start_codon:yes stop_codon:yes gene_type:complete
MKIFKPKDPHFRKVSFYQEAPVAKEPQKTLGKKVQKTEKYTFGPI